MCLAKNIRYLRLKKHYSQEDIAEKLGYKSYTTIQKSGISEPPVGKLRALSSLFGVDINDITSKDIEECEREGISIYYTNPATARLAQEMFEDPDLRALHHMKRNMDPEKFRAHMNMMKQLYKIEHPEDDDDFSGS